MDTDLNLDLGFVCGFVKGEDEIPLEVDDGYEPRRRRQSDSAFEVGSTVGSGLGGLGRSDADIGGSDSKEEG